MYALDNVNLVNKIAEANKTSNGDMGEYAMKNFTDACSSSMTRALERSIASYLEE